MLGSLKWIAPLLALGLMGFFAGTAQAADEKGTVTGTVLDKDGKAVEGAMVRIMAPRQRGDAPADGARKQADDPKPPAAGGGGGAGGRQRPPAIAEGTTDKDGKFSLQAPAGKYVVFAGVRGKGMGRAEVTVEAGKTVNVELKLSDAPPAGGAGGGRRPAADK